MAEELSERQKAALIRQQLSDANARGEAARAKVLIDEFLAAAKERGLQPRPLKARTLDGHTVKTDKTGWYLRTNHSVALDTEGNYYSLAARAPFSHLIYPIPEPGGLGVHLTLDLAGRARFHR